jgi:hypothetical protein
MLVAMSRKVDIPMKYLVPQCEEFGPIRLLKPGSIDFSVLKSWLDLCQTMHTHACTSQNPDPKSVQHLKLIDCHTRQIVPAKNADYVTLSYVWGRIEECHEYSEQLPSTLPSTIEDAIEVTQSLGFRYLWIDRYCINQQEKGHAYSQMNQMDLIYQNSEVTIVAAAGEDPSYGLPGVSRRERRPQPQAKIGSTLFITPLSTTRALIANSHWATRGWTYQEALLSRRRLVFTDEQVYFQCHGMHCYETFQIPREFPHTPNGQSLEEKYQLRKYGHGSGIFPIGVGTDDDAIFERISEYSRKSLTRQSDRLNAFLGVLRAFETLGTYNCWGTPLPRTIILSHPVGVRNLNEGFLCGLCWTASGASKAREPSLPSWSWTGWSGLVGYHHHYFYDNTLAIEISFELSDGSVLDRDDFRRRYHEINNPKDLSHFIHVLAPTLAIQNVSKNGFRYNCEVKMNDGWFLRWPFDTYSKEQLDYGSCKAFLVVTLRSEIFVMFVRRLEGSFERVWGDWKQCRDVELLRPDCEVADILDNTGSGIIKRYGYDWSKSLELTWETLRLG